MYAITLKLDIPAVTKMKTTLDYRVAWLRSTEPQRADMLARFHAMFDSKATFATGNHVDSLTPTKPTAPKAELADVSAKVAVDKGLSSQSKATT